MATVPTPIVDKNGKHTTVHKKADVAPAATRNVPLPNAGVTNLDRATRDVRDLFTRLSLPGGESVSNVDEFAPNTYEFQISDARFVAFDEARVGYETVSGIITKDETTGGFTGKLFVGNGVTDKIDAHGYAVNSASAQEDTFAEAADIAYPYL